MDKPILFLDIDGVLNSKQFLTEQKEKGVLDTWHAHTMICPVMLNRLKLAVQMANADVVLSSSWRYMHALDEIEDMFRHHGWDMKFLGKTPKQGFGYRIRGHEVAEWVEENGFAGRYVCLDDDSDFLFYQQLVQTDWAEGLAPDRAQVLLDCLLGKIKDNRP